MSDYSCSHSDCGKEYDSYTSLQSHYDYNPEHRPKDWDPCPHCGVRYRQLGKHWGNGCPHPNLTSMHIDILTGIMMGDGSGKFSDRNNTSIRIGGFITPEYLYWIDSVFGELSTGVREGRTGEEHAEVLNESGFSEVATAESCSDQYWWSTRELPELNQFAEWYSTGEKVFPEDIDMNPVIFKHWYVCDGDYGNSGSSNQIRISASNELGNQDKIRSYFTDSVIPEPYKFKTGERTSRSGKYMKIKWDVDSTKRIFELMDPAPGFEYKWPNYQ
jgi:hypothetical protein